MKNYKIERVFDTIRIKDLKRSIINYGVDNCLNLIIPLASGTGTVASLENYIKYSDPSNAVDIAFFGSITIFSAILADRKIKRNDERIKNCKEIIKKLK